MTNQDPAPEVLALYEDFATSTAPLVRLAIGFVNTTVRSRSASLTYSTTFTNVEGRCRLSSGSVLSS